MSPRVSVVVPVFNRPVAVRRAIGSILAQTCQDFEIIVVDDGSTDGTAAAVTSIPDGRITLIRHERNRGGSAARNTGIRGGSAGLVAFLDSDDEWLPTKLARQLEVFERADHRLGLVYTGSERIVEDGSVIQHIPRRHDSLVRTLLTDNVIGGTSVGMIRRSVLEAIGGFDELLPAGQDADLWLRVCGQCEVAFVPDILVRIWQPDDAHRISKNVAATLRGRELFYEKHRDALTRSGVVHLWHRDSGWVHHRYARDARTARQMYRRAIAAKPTMPLAYLLLASAVVPISWLDGVAKFKHWLERRLQPPQVVAPQPSLAPARNGREESRQAH